jgi:hypothetical protein
MDDRHGTRSCIITSKLDISKWYDLIPDPTIADALLDRIIYRSHKIDIRGPSMRKEKSGLTMESNPLSVPDRRYAPMRECALSGLLRNACPASPKYAPMDDSTQN